jgi:MFS family permease
MRHDTRGVWISQALSRPLAFTSDVLGLRRNMVVLSLTIFCVGLGEELWARFLPKYLEALGASVLAIGAFGAFQDLLEALYPYPGGVLADRWGRKRASVTFNGLALLGYGLYLVSPSWPFVFVGLACTMAWSSLALLATFGRIKQKYQNRNRISGKLLIL